jgi:hypothetical protein
MSLVMVIRLFSFWQMQLVALALILLLPLVCYLAAVKSGGRRRRQFVPPAEQAGE